MKKRLCRDAVNYFASILVVAGGLAIFALPLRAGEVFLEDFDQGWSNDPETKQLGAHGVWPSSWAFRLKNPVTWAVVESGGPQKKVLEFKGESFNNSWWSVGVSHGVGCAPGKSVQLDGWIREATPTSGMDAAYLWLSTPEQNGYGITAIRSNAIDGPPEKTNDGNNYAGIFKYRGSTVKFGESGLPEWTNQRGELPVPVASVEAASDEYLHFFLRLKQAAKGASVEIALYYNSTDSPPVMTWTDDGTKFGAVIDIENLTWVGITAANGPIPHRIQFDAIRVGLLP